MKKHGNIERNAVMDQKTIVEKLRECAKLLLEVANEIQLAEGASKPDACESGEGREAEEERRAKADYEKAIAVIRETRRASTSHFQRKIGWGYNHACVVIDRLEENGVIGPDTGGPREIFWDKIPPLDGSGAA